MHLKDKMTKAKKELASKYSLNVMAAPRLEKVTLNVGLKNFRENKEMLETIKKELIQIAGQQPKFTTAKKSISGFKLREGQTVGYAVNLRSDRMWGFVENLVNVVLPRMRDFDGIPQSKIDRNGNFTFGIKEQMIFPQMKADDVKQTWGMSVTFTIKNGRNKEAVREYFTQMGLIFK